MQNILGLIKYNEAATRSSTLTSLQRANSYSTKIISGVERLWRVRDVSADVTSPLKNWIVYTSNGIDGSSNFSDLILKAEDGITLKFLQDLDSDGIDAATEYMLGSSDINTASDSDGRTDAFEYYGEDPSAAHWIVNVTGKDSYHAFSSPARSDSDLDKSDD